MKNRIIQKLACLDAYLDKKRLGRRKSTLHDILWERAMLQSADFVEPHLSGSMVFPHSRQLFA